MLLRSVVLLYFISCLPVCPSQSCDRIGFSYYEESPEVSDSHSACGGTSINKPLNTHLAVRKIPRLGCHWLSIPPLSLNASVGDSKYLECIAFGRPAPTIHWLKDGIIKQGETPDVYHQHLPFTDPPSPNKRIEDGFIESRLYLDCLSVEDQGVYTCVAENPYHSVNASTTLVVTASGEIECEKSSHGEAPRINLWTKFIFPKGNETKLICRATGDPTPTIRWFEAFNGVELTDAEVDRYEVLPNGDLIVRNSSLSELSGYTCKAENVHGESVVESGVLRTRGYVKPKPVYAEPASRSSRSVKQIRRLRLHSTPPEALDLSGDSKYLECMAEGRPEPTIHWLKDGIRITQGETSDEYHQNSSSTTVPVSPEKIFTSFTSSRLYLDCLSVEDQGEYTCVAENTYSRISASTSLAVMSSGEKIECEKSQGKAPRINLWTKAKIAFKGQDAKFICRANGDPTPTVSWLGLEEEELMNDDSDKYEVLPNGDLIVRNANWSDMGPYTCIAANDHGEAQEEVFLYPTVDDV